MDVGAKIQKPDLLFSEIKTLVQQARNHAALVVFQSLTPFYYNNVCLIHHHILKGNRADLHNKRK